MKLFSFAKSRRPPEETFESLLESHLDGMYRVALSLTRNPVQAEDLVHDTAVRALRFKNRFEMGTHFRAWIYTVLHHTFVHRYRRKKREREILEGSTRIDVERQMQSEGSRLRALDPEGTYLENMLSDEVLAALESLPPEFRTVVTLCDIEGLAYKEIAEVIDRPVGTVMSRLYRGRRQLENKLRGVAVDRGLIRDDAQRASDGEAVVDFKKYRRQRG